MRRPRISEYPWYSFDPASLPDGLPDLAGRTAGLTGRTTRFVRQTAWIQQMEVEIGRGKKARRAYGFDDIAIVPSRRTRDPDDVDISWKLGDYRFELPLLASAMDGVVSPKTAGIIGQARRPGRPQPRGIFTRYEDADEQLERIAALPKEAGHARDAGDLPGARPRGADRPADPRDQGAGRRRRGVADAAARARYHELALEAGLDILVIQGTVVSGEHVSTASEPLNLKEFIPRSGARRRRRLRQLPHGPAPHAHRRGRRARRRRPGCRLHDARRARHRRPAGHGDRRRRRRPLPAHARDRRVRARSSPTAACATAATSPRRSPAAPTRS